MLLGTIAALIVGWFAAGTIWNVRRGNALLRWIQPALGLLGDRTTLRWLGSTAVELTIAKAKPPFEKVTLVVFLQPRDMPWLWLLSRRRDTLILRGELRTSPRFDLEALDRGSWSGRDARRKAEDLPARGDLDGRGVWSTLGLQEVGALLDGARCGLPVRRLSVRRTAPHLQLHLEAPKNAAPPGALAETFRELARRVTHVPGAAPAAGAESASPASSAGPAGPSIAGTP